MYLFIEFFKGMDNLLVIFEFLSFSIVSVYVGRVISVC